MCKVKRQASWGDSRKKKELGQINSEASLAFWERSPPVFSMSQNFHEPKPM